MKMNPLRFEAFHLFPIDLSVVTAILSAITTYLVVLIQFQYTEEQFMLQTGISYYQDNFIDSDSQFKGVTHGKNADLPELSMAIN